MPFGTLNFTTLIVQVILAFKQEIINVKLKEQRQRLQKVINVIAIELP